MIEHREILPRDGNGQVGEGGRAALLDALNGFAIEIGQSIVQAHHAFAHALGHADLHASIDRRNQVPALAFVGRHALDDLLEDGVVLFLKSGQDLRREAGRF